MSRAATKPKIIIYIAFDSALEILSLLKSYLSESQPIFTLSAIAIIKACNQKKNDKKVGARLITPLQQATTVKI
ncbi:MULTISPECIES: hypothetical protein [Cyanophyceae]|uniref:hypothetical protein n=1 Tax=Cyanophyceae TaxID=3028117 RepID=UPI0016865253|nr:hypothetical protein [Trichocoleus sp. FACHB-40]MBD2002080.1 hypothetical protein [Trichocoleus sp. FACHB-40]